MHPDVSTSNTTHTYKPGCAAAAPSTPPAPPSVDEEGVGGGPTWTEYRDESSGRADLVITPDYTLITP